MPEHSQSQNARYALAAREFDCEETEAKRWVAALMRKLRVLGGRDGGCDRRAEGRLVRKLERRATAAGLCRVRKVYERLQPRLDA